MRQLGLLAGGAAVEPGEVGALDRVDLGAGAWIDHRSDWLGGADAWLEQLREDLDWRSARRQMYDRVVDVPRLMAHFSAEDAPPELAGLCSIFAAHYGRAFPTVGCNWYRNGDDSVAWHADRVRQPGDSIVAIIGVGERRPFLLRPMAGGSSMRWMVGDGDLIVLGGTIQAHWQHAVPKVAQAGERISIMVRSSGIT